MKIVAAIDGSHRGPEVLSWALDRADPDDEVVALRVWNIALIGSLENPFADLHQAQMQATGGLNRLIDQVTKQRWDQEQQNVVVHADVRHGDPARELIAASATADMLVVGNAHHSGLGELGSIVRSVLRGAECAVALVPVPTHAETDEPAKPEAVSS